MCSGMYKETGVGKSKEEARRKAEEALKERLWREVWKDNVDVPREAVESVVEVCDELYEVTIEI